MTVSCTPVVPSSTPQANRQCSRPTCATLAVATLSYEYRRSLVWLDPLSPEREPHAYDLCARHADRLAVPSGWRLEDRRHDVPLAS